MANFKILGFILLFGFVSFSTFAQEATNYPVETKPCYQDKNEKMQLIEQAESRPLRVRRIEMSGNTTTRDRILRDRMVLKEGDIFRQSLLMRTIRNISKIKTIKPIRLEDVGIRLDRRDGSVDFVFCVVEKEKN